jgi:polar amino acid transport system substrate-binding protein
MSLAPFLALSWWLGFRIGFDGWSKSCRLRRKNLHGARRDKIQGDLRNIAQRYSADRDRPSPKGHHPKEEGPTMKIFPIAHPNLLTRRLMLGAMAALFAVPMVTSNAKAASLEEIKKRGLIVATEDDFRPFEFVKDGKPAGFDNELIENLRKYAPFEIKQEILPWTGILAGVSTGKYDVAITAVMITKERKQSLEFTSPIADATHYYVKRKDDKSISSIKDLNGKTVGVQAGSAFLARLPELGAMLEKTGGKLGKVVEYTSYPEAYQDLALGRVDYVVNTVINLQTLVAEKPIFEVGQAVSGPSFPAWAVAKDSKELLAFLNEFIAKEKASGRFAELQKKWFGDAFPNLPVKFEPEF